MARRRPGSRGIIFEFIPNGAYVKVSAVDEVTGREVSIVGDARASQAELERIARQKLERVLIQNNEKRR